MFMRPHNFQVLLEVGFDDTTLNTLRADRPLGAEGIYTFDPLHFPIAELDPSADGPVRTSMVGAVVRGHFERGGSPIATGITVDVRRVVAFSELDMSAKRAQGQQLSYLCFGRAGRLHLAHEVIGRPSFDQVLQVRLVPGTVTTLAGSPLPDDVATLGFDLAQPVRFGRNDLAESRLALGEVATGRFEQTSSTSGAHGFTVKVEVERELYLEIDELA
jgi:hypothetical protein